MSPLLPRRTRRASATVLRPAAPTFAQRPRARHPHFCHEATPGFAARYNLRGCAPPSGERCVRDRVRQVTLGTSLELPGRVANSRDRTCPPQADLPATGGLPPASLTVTTVYGRSVLIILNDALFTSE